MKRRLINPLHRSYPSEVISEKDETSQVEPNLHDILIAYQHGEDVSDYIRLPAAKATADQQFSNRIAKVDPLTEIPAYIAGETSKASAAVNADRLRAKKDVNVEVSQESDKTSE